MLFACVVCVHVALNNHLTSLYSALAVTMYGEILCAFDHVQHELHVYVPHVPNDALCNTNLSVSPSSARIGVSYAFEIGFMSAFAVRTQNRARNNGTNVCAYKVFVYGTRILHVIPTGWRTKSYMRFVLSNAPFSSS